jgi:hypothetical protein
LCSLSFLLCGRHGGWIAIGAASTALAAPMMGEILAFDAEGHEAEVLVPDGAMPWCEDARRLVEHARGDGEALAFFEAEKSFEQKAMLFPLICLKNVSC